MGLRRFLLIIAIIALGFFLYFFWSDVKEAFVTIRDAQWQWLLFIIPLQALNYLAHAMFFRSALQAIGLQAPSWSRLYGLSLAVAFTNTIVPSAGAAGMSLMAATLRSDGIRSGEATFVQLARYGAVYLSFTILLLFALVNLLIGGDVPFMVMVLVGMIAVGILVATALGAYLLYSRRALDTCLQFLRRLVDWVARRFRHGRNLIGVERMERLVTDILSGARRIISNRSYFKQPFWWGFLGNLSEVLSLYMVFVALGFAVNPGVVIIAYAIASGIGILTIVPGDIGVYEVAMITVFSIAGVPLAIGLSATILFRVINRVLMLPVGFYFYDRYILEVTHHE